MKKLITILVIALLLIAVQSAVADTGLSSMTTEELIALKLNILNELMDRGELKEIVVPSGVYVVGEHIPAGEYSVTIAEGSFMAMVTVNEYEQYYALSDTINIGRLVLKNNDVLAITNNVVFSKFVGLGF